MLTQAIFASTSGVWTSVILKLFKLWD
jgi:hypothetical protein